MQNKIACNRTYFTCCWALLLIVKFCARLARLLSKSPVKTLPVPVALTGCPAAEMQHNVTTGYSFGRMKYKVLNNIYTKQSVNTKTQVGI